VSALDAGSRFEQFEHGADVGVRGRGETPSRAFEAAAQALFLLLAADPRTVREERGEQVTCRATGLEELLVAFLNELIFLADTRRLVFGRFEVRIQEGEVPGFLLEARAFGERYDPSRHEATVEPKGATFTALRVAREGETWVAQCVVDV